MTLDVFLLYFCVVFAIATLGVLYLEDVSRRYPTLHAVAMPAVGHACATVAVVSWFDALSVSLVASMLGLLITGFFMLVLRSFSVTGRFLIAAQLTMSAVALVWGLHYLWTIDVSATTRVLMLSTLPPPSAMTKVCPPVDRNPSGNCNGRDGFSLVILPAVP